MSFKGRVIAFYLPQFHPIPENDDWWGKGFTEWTNVTKARPLFPGHYQPHLPADLGFYDLRLPEARRAQAELAREYDIHGFCYYHYWFNGKRLLERPFSEVLASGQPTLPFCLCWANESWTRRWDGKQDQVLIDQTYSEQDDLAHIGWLATAFRDERYIRVDGKPLFLVYRASRMPQPLKTTSLWREEARKLGCGDLYLCRVESFADERGDPATLGFDAAVEFQPDWSNCHLPRRKATHRLHDYSLTVDRMLRKDQPHYKRFPCVTPSWDNSSRRATGATILAGSTPALYERWLRAAVLEAEQHGAQGDTLVFINAWNEWGEGNHLEPCQRWGRAYLEATARAVRGGDEVVPSPDAAGDSIGGHRDAVEYLRTLDAVRCDALGVLRRARGELIATSAELEEAREELTRLGRLQLATQELGQVIPPGSVFISVDQQEWGSHILHGRHAIPFLERNGQYWGPPPDDATAIAELARLRQAGASFMVFGWPAFWWLDHYAGLDRHLRCTFPCRLENDRLVVFDLRG